MVGTRFHHTEVCAPPTCGIGPRRLSMGLRFDDETHISANFLGHADFKRCRFGAAAAFTDSTFREGSPVQRVHFSADTTQHMASFLPGVDFANVLFREECGFTQVNFGRSSRFTGAEFIGGLDAKRATFQGDSSFEHATFNRSIDFSTYKEMGWKCPLHGRWYRLCIDQPVLGQIPTLPKFFFWTSKGGLRSGPIRRGWPGSLGDSCTLSLEECRIFWPLSLSREPCQTGRRRRSCLYVAPMSLTCPLRTSCWRDRSFRRRPRPGSVAS